MIGPFLISERSIRPRYFDAADVPWIRSIVEEYGRHLGLPRKILRDRFQEPLPCPGPIEKQRLLIRLLDRLARDKVRPATSPRRIRGVVFVERARSAGARESVLAAAATRLGLTVEEVEAGLFADLPEERLLEPLPAGLTAASLVARANLELVQILLRRAIQVRLRVTNQSCAVVRSARARGLICTVEGDRDACELSFSGPLAVFRRTTVYGRALMGLAPLLSWCGRVRLRARCWINDSALDFEFHAGDAELPGSEPRRFDSRLEERFFAEISRRAIAWEVLREPEPVPLGTQLLFPDFLLVHRHDPDRRWWVEIIGYWTPEYLRRKLAGLRAAGIPRLILCVDQDRACGDEKMPRGAVILPYRRRVDVEGVLSVIEGDRAGR